MILYHLKKVKGHYCFKMAFPKIHLFIMLFLTVKKRVLIRQKPSFPPYLKNLRLADVLRMFLFFPQNEAGRSYKGCSYKKKSVYLRNQNTFKVQTVNESRVYSKV